MCGAVIQKGALVACAFLIVVAIYVACRELLASEGSADASSYRTQVFAFRSTRLQGFATGPISGARVEHGGIEYTQRLDCTWQLHRPADLPV